MERGLSEHQPLEVLSPSRITDYFVAKKAESSDKQDNDSCDANSSSVYLTPKSSPSKDEEKSPTDELNGEAECKPVDSTSPSKLSKSSPSLNHHNNSSLSTSKDLQKCKSDKPLVCSKNDSSPSDASKRKSNQHRICQISQSTIDSETVGSAHNAPSEEKEIVSSPTVPRSKVRKNSKPSAAKTDSQPKPAAVTTQAPPAATKSKPGRKKKVEPVQSTAITDYFPIRRSGRQTKAQIEKETQLHLEKLLASNCEDGLEVKDIEGKGRGVVATKLFDKGDFVVEYAGDMLSVDRAKDREAKYALTPSIGCYMYFFQHGNKQYCVDATQESGRLGRLLNHSRSGNCCTRVITVDDSPRLILVAARHIKCGDELSYDYGDRSKEALEAHPWLKL